MAVYCQAEVAACQDGVAVSRDGSPSPASVQEAYRGDP